MKRPSFQFYPADLRNNVKLRRCSWAARGVWMEIMCLFHDSDEYGILRWTLEEIAQAVGCPKDLVCELVEKGVLKGSEKVGEKVSFSESFSQRNAPSISVVLIDSEDTPLWYSSRMVRDEYVRAKRGANGIKSLENPNVPQRKGSEKEIDKDADKVVDKDTFSPSPTSSSSSSLKDKKTSSSEDDGKQPKVPYDEIFDAYEQVLCVDPFNRPTVKLRDDKRKAAIKRIVKARPNAVNPEWWENYFRAASENDHWMQGDKHKGGTWAGANFDFLLRDDVFKRILEGAA